MAIAELHGKSPLSNSEDFLTADVFGAFRYLPPAAGILGFLRGIPGVGDILPEPSSSASCDYHFWPRGVTREPDVLLALTIGERRYHVVVEAKYLSGPSDQVLEEIEHEETLVQWGNQLADQLRELRAGEYTVYENGSRDRKILLDSRPVDRLLLYLTADVLAPREVLQRSRALVGEDAPPLFWANWYDVYDHLAAQQSRFTTFPFDRIVGDFLQLLRQKQFASFQGIAAPDALSGRDLRGGFWTGRRNPLPTFHGIRPLPPLRMTSRSGAFFEVSHE